MMMTMVVVVVPLGMWGTQGLGIHIFRGRAMIARLGLMYVIRSITLM